MLNPFSAIASTFYRPMKAAILGAWQAAKEDALAEIRADLPGDADLKDVALALRQARGEPTAALPALIDADPEQPVGKRRKQ